MLTIWHLISVSGSRQRPEGGRWTKEVGGLQVSPVVGWEPGRVVGPVDFRLRAFFLDSLINARLEYRHR
jgi:hypothetical protein